MQAGRIIAEGSGGAGEEVDATVGPGLDQGKLDHDGAAQRGLDQRRVDVAAGESASGGAGGRPAGIRTGGSGPVRANSSRPGNRICHPHGCPGTGIRGRVHEWGKELPFRVARKRRRQLAGARILQEILPDFMEITRLSHGSTRQKRPGAPCAGPTVRFRRNSNSPA